MPEMSLLPQRDVWQDRKHTKTQKTASEDTLTFPHQLTETSQISQCLLGPSKCSIDKYGARCILGAED